MSNKDDDIDGMGLDDDFGLGDMDLDTDAGVSDGLTDVDASTRTPVAGVIADTSTSFVESFTDDKVQTVLDLGRVSIPKSLSKETDVVANAYGTISDEVSAQGSKLRREAKKSLRTIKRFLPDDDSGFLNKIVNKTSSLLGDDATSTSGPTGPTQAEIIAGEVRGLMGEKQGADILAEQFKEQLAFTRQQEVKEIQATESLNVERIRKFMFEVSDRYYRTSLDVSLRHLYSSEQLLAVTKSGFDIFKTSFAAIIKNTALPDVVKIRNQELAGQMIKEKLFRSLGSSVFKNGTPIERLVDKATKGVKNYSESAINVLQGVSGQSEQIGSMSGQGMGVGDIIGMLAADAAKNAAGNVAGKYLEKNDKSAKAIWDAKNYAADPRLAAKTLSKKKGVLGKAGSLLYTTMGSGESNFTVDQLDPNSAAYLDNRTKDSINKIIPQLLSKIYGEVKTSRELQMIATPGGSSLRKLRIGDPSSKELIYDPAKGELINRKGLSKSIRDLTTKDAVNNVAAPTDTVVSEFVKDSVSGFSQEELASIRKGVIESVLRKGHTSAAMFTDEDFLEGIGDPELVKKITKQQGIFKSRTMKDDSSLDRVNSNLKYIQTSNSQHENIAKDLVDRGLTREALDAGLLVRNDLGDLVGNRDGIIDDIVTKASSGKISVDSSATPSIKEELAGLSFKDKASFIGKKIRQEARRRSGLDSLEGPEETISVPTTYGPPEPSVLDKAKAVRVSVKRDTATSRIRDKVDQLSGNEDIASYASSIKDKVLVGIKRGKEIALDKTNNTSITGTAAVALDKVRTKLSSNEYLNAAKEKLANKWEDISAEQQELLRLEFFKSAEYRSEAITDFKSWLQDMKGVDTSILNTASGLVSTATTKFKDTVLGPVGKYKDALLKEITAKLTGTDLKELSTEEEEVKRQEFFKSVEFRGGYVKDFGVWLKSQGFVRYGMSALGSLKRSLRPSAIFKKTRALDRKLMGAFYKNLALSPLHIAKGGYKLSKAVVNGFSKKSVDKTEPAGADAPNTSGLSKLLSYFRRKDKDIATAKSSDEKARAKESKRNRFLSMFTKDKDSDVSGKKSGMLSKILKKGGSFITPTTVAIAAAAAITALGLTADDIKDGIKSVGSGISKTWGYFKSFLGYIRDTFNYIKQLPERMSLTFREALSKIPLLGIDKPDSSEYTALDNGLNKPADGTADVGGEPGAPGVDGVGATTDTGVSNLQAVGTVAGLYAAKKTYNGARRVGRVVGAGYRGAKAVADVGARGYNLTKSVVGKARNIVSKKPDVSVKKAGIASKLKSFISKLKTMVLKKMGPKVGAKLIAKIALRAVPVLGWGLLLVDAGTIMYYMAKGDDFKVAASKTILGFNILDTDTEEPVSDNVIPLDRHPEYKHTGINAETRNPYSVPGSNAGRPNIAVINKEIRASLNDSGIEVDNNSSSRKYKSVNTKLAPGQRVNSAEDNTPTIIVEPVIKVETVVNLDESKHLTEIAKMSGMAVDLQTQMLGVLGDISTKLDRTLDPVGNVSKLPPKVESLPTPAINVRRRTSFN